MFEWFLMLLRFLLGLPQQGGTESQPLAVRPDGTTTPLPPESVGFSGRSRWRDWLTLLLHVVPRNREGRIPHRDLSPAETRGSPRSQRWRGT